MPRIPTRLTPEVVAEFSGGGYWPNLTLGDVLRRQARAWPGKTAVVDARTRVTYGALDRLVDRVAAGLAAHGVCAGDVVSSLLPNRAETVVLLYAVARLGAVANPIVPIYGAREIRFILRQAESVVVVVPERLRGVDYAALVERVRPDVPSLRATFFVRETFPDALLVEPGLPPPAPDPDDVAVILYTSGTTADPKGVLHSHNTLLSECRCTRAYHHLGADEVLVMPSPVSHISGLLYGVLLPVVLGATSVLMERWDPDEFCALVERERGTFSAGATPFLQGAVEAAAGGRHDLSSLRLFPCGGADVPPDLIRRAVATLAVRSGRGYGSTEFPSITSSAGPDVPERKRAETDGAPVPPNRIELRDEAGRAVRPGAVGEIWARGPELCLGYRDAALDAEAFDARGFFRTGDLGMVDADGYLTITGRVKDIIVRAGEKFSAKEIEDLLFEHPKVRHVAVVPVPDTKVGERVCAVVVPADPAAPPTLPELACFLEACEVSRRKLPERLELADELPATASGKVQKHLLRVWVARRARGGT
jgi:acyl-CoA synthetase (AMP-forming)/AMP-acid ligase II